MEGTPAELAESSMATFNARIKGIFDTTGPTIDRSIITLPAAPEQACPQSTFDAYQAAVEFEMMYEDCLTYAPWLDARV